MKKILLLLLVLNFMLYGCDIPEEIVDPIDNPVTCLEDEELISGICVPKIEDEEPIDEEPDDEVFCADNEVILGICMDITPPVIMGESITEVAINTSFSPLADMQAIDDVDGDITDKLEYTGSPRTDKYGTYILKYKVSDAVGNETIFIRELRVVYKEGAPKGPEMAPNGDLANGLENWSFLNNSNGASMNVSNVNGILKLEITSGPDEPHFWIPRAEFKNLTFEQGKTYYVAFDIWSEEKRILQLQIGDLLPQDPWFIDFRPSQRKLYYTEPVRQTIEVIFTMYHDTNDDGVILFELGNIYGINVETTVYIDNLTVFELK